MWEYTGFDPVALQLGPLAVRWYGLMYLVGILSFFLIGGILAADLATGRDNPAIADMQSLGSPDILPPRPFLDLGVRARFRWELFGNRHEA